MKGRDQEPTFPYYRSIHESEKFVVRDDAYSSTGERAQRESREEMIDRITHYRPEPTNHSTLASNIEFMKRVVAWDLPIGFCEAYDDRALWHNLISFADWTSGHDTYFDYGTFEKVEKPDAVDWATVAEAISKAQADRFQYGENYKGGENVRGS
ncbi:MAG TPA: DUF3274 domain-containing protein [Paraburkholderia sp.]|jgi:hypothetical protein|nr:DUF3274 domain-containing protein [Paraburkholderia sp.]